MSEPSIEITRELEKLLEDYEWYDSEYAARQVANYVRNEVEKAIRGEEDKDETTQ